jgi:hypothetical protein
VAQRLAARGASGQGGTAQLEWEYRAAVGHAPSAGAGEVRVERAAPHTILVATRPGAAGEVRVAAVTALAALRAVAAARRTADAAVEAGRSECVYERAGILPP